MAKKILDQKLAAIRAGKYKPADFIIADAKDGDIGFGRRPPVPIRNGRVTPCRAPTTSTRSAR